MPDSDRLLVQLALFALLAATLWVLVPFLSSLFWASVLAFASWPAMRWLTKLLDGRESTAAGILTAGWVLLVALPLVGIGFNLATHVKDATELFKNLQAQGFPEPPVWLAGLPLVGETLNDMWIRIDEQGAALFAAIKPYIGMVGNWLLERSAQIGGGIVELVLSLVLVYFFYRDGPQLALYVRRGLHRLIGDRAEHYLVLVAGTVQRVVNGVIGTAAAQAALALIGFWIVEVPGAPLLALLVFGMSLVPMGPPLVWVPVTAWLALKGDYGLAIFLGLWGTLAISGVDNVLKPYLISRGGDLPLVIVLFGVFGGLYAFGFMGLFLGPILLAVAYSLIEDWINKDDEFNRVKLSQNEYEEVQAQPPHKTDV